MLPATAPPDAAVPLMTAPFPAGAEPCIAGGAPRLLWLLHGCGFALLITALAVVVAIATRTGEADSWVTHTLEVRNAAGLLLSAIQEAEADGRDYLLSREPGAMQAYAAARDAVPDAVARLRLLVGDSGPQMARIDALAPIIAERMGSLEAKVVLALEANDAALASTLHDGSGTRLMQQIKTALAAFDRAESDTLAKRESTARAGWQHLQLGAAGTLTLALLLGGFTALLSHRQARALRDANTRLADTINHRTLALRESERRFRQVFHDNPIGLSIATADTRRIVAANPALCRLLGYTEAELIGRSEMEVTHPGDPAPMTVSTDPAQPWQPVERRYLSRGGAVVFTRAAMVPLALPAEDEPLVLCTTEDISREREIETALRASEERMRLAVEAAGLGVWEHDLSRNLFLLDEEASKLTGDSLPPNVWLDLEGPQIRAWYQTLHNEDAASVAATWHALRDGSTDRVTQEFRVRCETGWIWLSAFSVIAERAPDSGRGMRLLTILHDITQRREAEIELRHAHRLEAVGQLTGGVAHDFNNLLGAILGHTEFLLDLLSERSEERELAMEILDCTLNGAALAQRLLAFARRQPLQPAVIDLNEYLPVHVSLLQRTLGETVSVDMELGPELWLTHADPSQIVDVLLNLAINARDAMPHGGQLTIATANVTLDAAFCARNPEATPGDYVSLAVTDTGTGMAPEILARAVEPFFTTKPPGKGSGLGLSTIYGFARQSGGYLSIDSSLGKGTTVRLYLPRTMAERSVTGTAPNRPPPLPRGSETILVVDDNDAMRTTAARNLAALGYNVRLASDGPTALALLQGKERFDLLFTDMVMPNGLNGYQLAEAARVLRPGLPVLFTTGFAPEDDAETGVTEVNALRKPYRRRELAERVRSLLATG